MCTRLSSGLWRLRPQMGLARISCALLVNIILLAGCTAFASPTPTPEPVTLNFAFPAYGANYYDEQIQTLSMPNNRGEL